MGITGIAANAVDMSAGVLPALSFPLSKYKIISKDKILSGLRGSMGKIQLSPILGLKNAIIAHKARLVAEHLRKQGISHPRIGVIVGTGHYYILKHFDKPELTKRFLRRYKLVLPAETEIGLLHEFRFNGKDGKWLRKDLQLE